MNIMDKLKNHSQNLKTIGFFGDSFCADMKSEDYETYIMKLVKRNRLIVTSLGYRGSSIWDTMLLQFLPLINNSKVPDILVFVWTDETRLFHRQFRDITIGTFRGEKTEDIYRVADEYYKNFLDLELMQFQYASALKYFDSEILSKLLPDKKIIHLRSYSMPWLQKYNFKWKHGVEVKQELKLLTDPDNYMAANHIYGEENNQILFERIQNALENWDSIQLEKHSGIK